MSEIVKDEYSLPAVVLRKTADGKRLQYWNGVYWLVDNKTYPPSHIVVFCPGDEVLVVDCINHHRKRTGRPALREETVP